MNRQVYSEGWKIGFFGSRKTNPYVKGWAREALAPPKIQDLIKAWDKGWWDGVEAARCERVAEDDSRKSDAKEGFDE